MINIYIYIYIYISIVIIIVIIVEVMPEALHFLAPELTPDRARRMKKSYLLLLLICHSYS